MVGGWYYAEARDRSSAPMTIEELGRVLKTRANATDFLVWHPGMPDWGRAIEQFALRGYFSPPVPLQGDIAGGEAAAPGIANPGMPRLEQHDASPHPWRRYFARMFDLYVFFILFFMLLGVAFPRLFAKYDKSLDVLSGVIGAAAYAVFEGFWTNVFGASLGKRLYAIRIERTNGEEMTLGASLQRSFTVWIKGIGIGIPLISLVTLIAAHRRLSLEGQTSWDRDFHFRVSHRKLSWLRWLFILLLWLFLIAIYGFLIALGNQA